jgi:hypothetical protein
MVEHSTYICTEQWNFVFYLIKHIFSLASSYVVASHFFSIVSEQLL